jgi:hypothetical protein
MRFVGVPFTLRHIKDAQHSTAPTPQAAAKANQQGRHDRHRWRRLERVLVRALHAVERARVVRVAVGVELWVLDIELAPGDGDVDGLPLQDRGSDAGGRDHVAILGRQADRGLDGDDRAAAQQRRAQRRRCFGVDCNGVVHGCLRCICFYLHISMNVWRVWLSMCFVFKCFFLGDGTK